MYRQKAVITFIITIMGVFLLLNGIVNAEVIEAKTGSYFDVNVAINSARSGDIVTIPAGNYKWSNSCSIDSGGTITIPENVTVIGAGIGRTIINASNTLFILNSYSRLSAIEIEFNSGGVAYWDIMIRAYGDNWRVDNCKIVNTYPDMSEFVLARNGDMPGGPKGLVDHCYITNARVVVDGNGNFDEMCAIWAEDLGLGTNNAVFIEDCTFTATIHCNAVDGNRGGRYVFRYNTLNDIYIEAHSLQDNGERSIRSWEIYGNTINQVNRGMWVPAFLRGGTGVFYDNTIIGDWNNGPALDNVRCFRDIGGDGGQCDGNSDYDENTPGEIGWMCRDQIGAGKDDSLWTYGNPYPKQSKEPAFFWNNRDEYGNEVTPFVHNNCGNWIQINRDYYIGIKKPGYSPYTYPHPLVQDSGVSSEMKPPKNVYIRKQ